MIVPIVPLTPGQTLEKVNLDPVLEFITEQMEVCWTKWDSMQIDLHEVLQKMREAGIDLPEGMESQEKVEKFTVGLCNLLGWEPIPRRHNEEWWIGFRRL